MKFDDVEEARKLYSKKKKTISLTCILIIVLLSIAAIALIINHDTNEASRLFNGLIASVFLFITLLVFISPAIFFIVITILISKIVISKMTIKEKNAYNRIYKAYFVSRQLGIFFTDLQYDHENGLNKDVLDETNVIYTGDEYYSNDLVIGKYKNVDFTQADVTIEDVVTDDDGHKSYISIFNGKYMIFKFPKKFNYKMIVVPKSDSRAISRLENSDFKKIEIESLDFNKEFNIYAQDEFETFYILNPALISNIEEFGKIYNNNLSLYFVNNRLFIGINDDSDSFEPPAPRKKIDEKAEIGKVIYDIKIITDFVDRLNLN